MKNLSQKTNFFRNKIDKKFMRSLSTMIKSWRKQEDMTYWMWWIMLYVKWVREKTMIWLCQVFLSMKFKIFHQLSFFWQVKSFNKVCSFVATQLKLLQKGLTLVLRIFVNYFHRNIFKKVLNSKNQKLSVWVLILDHKNKLFISQTLSSNV